MSQAKINRNTKVYFGELGREVTSGTTSANTFYQVVSRAANTALPTGKNVGGFFKSPASGTQIALAGGDIIRPYDNIKEICQTTCSLSLSEGSVDVHDSCSEYMTKVLVGHVEASGTLNGFFKYDENNNKLVGFSDVIKSRFFDVLKDEGTDSGYTFIPRANKPILISILWNKDTEADGYHEEIIAFINLESVTFGGDQGAVQARDISFSFSDKGRPTFITRKITAGEVV